MVPRWPSGADIWPPQQLSRPHKKTCERHLIPRGGRGEIHPVPRNGEVSHETYSEVSQTWTGFSQFRVVWDQTVNKVNGVPKALRRRIPGVNVLPVVNASDSPTAD